MQAEEEEAVEEMLVEGLAGLESVGLVVDRRALLEQQIEVAAVAVGITALQVRQTRAGMEGLG